MLRHAGPWTRLAYVAAVTSDFREEWVAIADDAHRLTARLLESALGDHAPKATKVALLAAYTPAAKGGLGIPAPLVEVAFAADRQALFDVLDDPVSMVDDIEDRQELVARRRGIAYDIMGTLLAVTCGASDLALVRLAHQARGEVRGLWSVNACERDRMIADPRVASKVLDAWLFGSLVEEEHLCGEAAPYVRADKRFGEHPTVGPEGSSAVHCHGCNKNKTVLHDRVRDVVADIGYSVDKRCVLTEKGINDQGQPCTVSKRQGHAVPGDVVCRKGRSGAWVFADMTVVLNTKGLEDEAALIRAGKHQMVLTERANKMKCVGRTQGGLVMSSFGDYRSVAVSAFGAFDAVTEQSLRGLAAAVDSHTDVPEPMRAPSTAARMMSAVSWATHVGAAAFALTFPQKGGVATDPFQAVSALSERLDRAIDAPRARDADWWHYGRRPAILRSLSVSPEPARVPVGQLVAGDADGVGPTAVAELRAALGALVPEEVDVSALFDGVGSNCLPRGVARGRVGQAAQLPQGQAIGVRAGFPGEPPPRARYRSPSVSVRSSASLVSSPSSSPSTISTARSHRRRQRAPAGPRASRCSDRPTGRAVSPQAPRREPVGIASGSARCAASATAPPGLGADARPPCPAVLPQQRRSQEPAAGGACGPAHCSTQPQSVGRPSARAGGAVSGTAGSCPLDTISDDITSNTLIRRPACSPVSSSETVLRAHGGPSASRPHCTGLGSGHRPGLGHQMPMTAASAVAGGAQAVSAPVSHLLARPLSARRRIDPNDTATADRLRLEAAASGRRPGSVRVARGGGRGRGGGRSGGRSVFGMERPPPPFVARIVNPVVAGVGGVGVGGGRGRGLGSPAGGVRGGRGRGPGSQAGGVIGSGASTAGGP